MLLRQNRDGCSGDMSLIGANTQEQSNKGPPMTLYMQCECGHSITAETDAAIVTNVVAHVQQTHPTQMHRIYRECLNQLHAERSFSGKHAV